jgi:hypothetical protein
VLEEPVIFVALPSCFACASKASKVFALDLSAFAVKTMPAPQWLVWQQYAQIREVLFTWMVNIGNVMAFALTSMLTVLNSMSDMWAA